MNHVTMLHRNIEYVSGITLPRTFLYGEKMRKMQILPIFPYSINYRLTESCIFSQR